MTQDIAIFSAMTAKMGYLAHRQQVLTRNIANGDTPGYVPKDLTKPDFSALLKGATGGNDIQPVRTHQSHMPAGMEAVQGKQRDQRTSYEVAPAGNAVIIEEQLMKAGENNMDYRLMTTLYRTHMSMMRTALGRSGQ